MPIPREALIDATLPFLREGYLFISHRCDRLEADAFWTRILLRNVLCARGQAASRMFYEPGRFTRVGAMPINVLKLLQDEGSVQTLDGPAHRHRKELFLSIASGQEAARLRKIFAADFADRTDNRWVSGVEISLFDEVREALCISACHWAGIALNSSDVKSRTRELSEMIESTGSLGPRLVRALWLRRRAERWAHDVLRRADLPKLPAHCAVRLISEHRDQDGEPLKPEAAAVELLNVVRPIVAVARFIVFAALALHQHPNVRRRLRSQEPYYADWFATEVRRNSPFFPCIGGIALHPFEWMDETVPRGAWVLLDLYGTNRHLRSWIEPDAFRPQRYETHSIDAFDFVPQGGGDPHDGHRCPGEALTTELIKAAAQILANREYEVPAQDLSVDLSRIPALPRSGFVIRPSAVHFPNAGKRIKI